MAASPCGPPVHVDANGKVVKLEWRPLESGRGVESGKSLIVDPEIVDPEVDRAVERAFAKLVGKDGDHVRKLAAARQLVVKLAISIKEITESAMLSLASDAKFGKQLRNLLDEAMQKATNPAARAAIKAATDSLGKLAGLQSPQAVLALVRNVGRAIPNQLGFLKVRLPMLFGTAIHVHAEKKLKQAIEAAVQRLRTQGGAVAKIEVVVEKDLKKIAESLKLPRGVKVEDVNRYLNMKVSDYVALKFPEGPGLTDLSTGARTGQASKAAQRRMRALKKAFARNGEEATIGKMKPDSVIVADGMVAGVYDFRSLGADTMKAAATALADDMDSVADAAKSVAAGGVLESPSLARAKEILRKIEKASSEAETLKLLEQLAPEHVDVLLSDAHGVHFMKTAIAQDFFITLRLSAAATAGDIYYEALGNVIWQVSH